MRGLNEVMARMKSHQADFEAMIQATQEYYTELEELNQVLFNIQTVIQCERSGQFCQEWKVL